MRALSRIPPLVLIVCGTALLLSSACRPRQPQFNLSGSISLASRLQNKTPHANSVLFIIAKNQGGVPVAVRRVVNPSFPMDFSLGPRELLVPGAKPQPPFLLQVQLNGHGNVGDPVEGDLEGGNSQAVHLGETGIRIMIDRVVASPPGKPRWKKKT